MLRFASSLKRVALPGLPTTVTIPQEGNTDKGRRSCPVCFPDTNPSRYKPVYLKNRSSHLAAAVL